MAGTVHLVTGPPCGGKTFYVNLHRDKDDVVVDVDALRVAMGGHDFNGGTQHVIAMKIAGQIVYEARTLGYTVWFITVSHAPKIEYDDLVLIDPGIETCYKRAIEQRPSWTKHAIKTWYANSGDTESPSRMW